MRKLLFALLAVLLIAGTAMAGVIKTDKGIEEFRGLGYTNPAYNGRDFFEGFEDGVPPAGWTYQQTADYTWEALDPSSDDTPGALEGTYALYIRWDSVNNSDEWVAFDQTVDVAGGESVLSFFTAGDYDNGYADLATETVEINDVVVWDFDSVSSVSYTWEKYFIDLSEYDGQTVNIKFHYVGLDANSHYFDAIMVDGGTGYTPPPPPPAPENDTCEGAYDNEYVIPPGAFSLVGNNTYANADYHLNSTDSCTGYSFSGLDLVWVVCMEEGDVLDVTMTTDTGWDASFYMVSDCADPQYTCVVGEDDPEEILYTATETGVYYLICGGYSSGAGEFYLDGMLTGAGCGTVATEDTNWGSLKSLYR